MKFSRSLAAYPAGRPLNADQILEYHAARLVLLVRLCGARDAIHGLTKLAKLDFFVRYPEHFERAAAGFGASRSMGITMNAAGDPTMVRHHYGPWDPRYYQVLAYLESRQLLTVTKDKKTFIFALTRAGRDIASRLADEATFADLTEQMRRVKTAFGGRSGDWLKRLVYEVFDAEVAKLSLGQVIR